MSQHKPLFFAHESVYIDPPCRIGEDTEIGHYSHIMANSKVGARCRIGHNVIISPACEIGDEVHIGENVALSAGQVLEHRVFCGPSVVFAEAAPDAQIRPGRIKTGARIGANATILQGQVIGSYSLVEAGTLVSHNVPDHAIVGGNPMRQSGWICRCGAELELSTEVEAVDSARCQACARVYEKHLLQVSERSESVGAGCDVAVPLLDLKPQYRSLETEIQAALREVCASQQFILGPRVERLEGRIAEYSQCRYGVGVSSGTDALLLALMALGVGPGDEVITTAYSFFATAGTIARLGARPLFCDIEPNTYNLSPAAVERFIDESCELQGGALVNRATGGTVKTLLPVHLFGLCADMSALGGIARRYGLSMVEDAAQAIGAEDADGRRAGGRADIGCFSFFPSKNLGAFGDAGMCTTNDPELAERMRTLRVHGAEAEYRHAAIGGNFRLDELQAAVLNVKLNYLDRWTAQRQRNAEFYDANFAQIEIDDQLSTPWAPDGYRHVYNQYVIRVKQRDELRKFLAEAQIGTAIYYPVPLPGQPCFAYLGCSAEDYPEALSAARETLALPVYPELEPRQKRHVADSITALLR